MAGVINTRLSVCNFKGGLQGRNLIVESHLISFVIFCMPWGTVYSSNALWYPSEYLLGTKSQKLKR
jgi:hypothetical protein